MRLNNSKRSNKSSKSGVSSVSSKRAVKSKHSNREKNMKSIEALNLKPSSSIDLVNHHLNQTPEVECSCSKMFESSQVQINMDLKCLADLAFFNQQNLPILLNQQIDEDYFNEEEKDNRLEVVESNRPPPFEYVMHNGTRTLVIGKILNFVIFYYSGY